MSNQYITKAEFEAFKASIAKQLCACNYSGCGGCNDEAKIINVIVSGNQLLVQFSNGVTNTYTLATDNTNPIVDVQQNTTNAVFIYKDGTSEILNLPNKFVASIQCTATGIITHYTDGTSVPCNIGGTSFNGVLIDNTDTCPGYLNDKLDITSVELLQDVNKNIINVAGCKRIELEIPKGKWETILNDDLSRVEINITISTDGGNNYTSYQFLLSNVPVALSSIFQAPLYIRKHYTDLYNKIGTVSIYLRFRNVSPNILVKNLQIDFLNALPYVSVGSDYTVFTGLGDNSKEVFTFITTTQNTQNLVLNNMLGSGTDAKPMTFNFTISGQITYQIK
jgi:hypothetical protein